MRAREPRSESIVPRGPRPVGVQLWSSHGRIVRHFPSHPGDRRDDSRPGLPKGNRMTRSKTALALLFLAAAAVVSQPACAGPKEKGEAKKDTRPPPRRPRPRATRKSSPGSATRPSRWPTSPPGRRPDPGPPEPPLQRPRRRDRRDRGRLPRRGRGEEAGITKEALVQKEVTDKIKPVSDDDVKKFYEENKGRIPPTRPSSRSPRRSRTSSPSRARARRAWPSSTA